MPKEYPYNYRLWYVPEMPLEDIPQHHLQFDKARTQFLETVQAHIAKNGLQSPIYMNLRNGELRVRRGNNRVVALSNLERRTVPAFVVDYDPPRRKARPGWELLPYDRDALQQRFFSRGNCILQLHRRSASVVVPHVPAQDRRHQYA